MRITLTNILWQFVLFIFLFVLGRWLVGLANKHAKQVGWSERLFPREILLSEKLSNEHRATIAEQILKSYQNEKLNKDFKLENEIEIRVVASDRGGTYLLQTVALLMEQQNFGRYNLSICNVEKTMFEDLKKFEKIVPIMQLDTGVEKSLQVNSTIYKENLDYWQCLGRHSDSKYVLLIEDDSLVVSEFSDLIHSLVRVLDSHIHIDFVKLYHPFKLRKIPSIFHAIAVSIIFSFISCLSLSKLYKEFPILTFVLLSCSLSYFISGYGSLFPAEVRFRITGSAYVTFPESCCTQAVIFRRSKIEEMLVYFNKSVGYQGHAKDHILDDSPFVGRQTDLNYVQHIGSFSSVRHKTVFLSDFSEIRQ